MSWLAAALDLELRRVRRALLARQAEAQRRISALPAARRRELEETARGLVELRERALRLTTAGGAADCCADCAARLRRLAGEPPDPSFPGGHCCSGEGARTLGEAELAVLCLAGRSPARRPAARPWRGCLFRSPAGCTLAPAERPTLCVRYLCDDLKRSLQRHGALAAVLACCDELEAGALAIAGALDLERLAAP